MVPLLDGIRAAFPTSGIAHAPGVATNSDDASGIPAALDAARDADVVILCLGEARGMSGEAASRGLPDLPGRQAELARAVLDLGKPTVVLLSCGRPLPVAWLFERADAVLCTWFLGSEAGNAVGDILSGRADPGGRLPVTWPADPGQIPIFYSQLPTGRPPDPANVYSSKYLDLPTEPLFPFGHGLSYARFTLEPPRVTPAELRPGGTATVEVDVRNEGEVAGETTVLLFVHGPATYPARRVLELRGMARLGLPAGGQGTVRFAVSTDDLATPGPDLAPRLVPGDYELLVGFSAERKGLLAARLRLRT